ncbi:MAG: HTH domain-containing protein [Bacilli bacterium]
MDIKEQILQAMQQANQPLSAGDIEKITGLDRKTIDKAFNDLKKEGKIFSPIRCKWQPK